MNNQNFSIEPLESRLEMKWYKVCYWKICYKWGFIPYFCRKCVRIWLPF